MIFIKYIVQNNNKDKDYEFILKFKSYNKIVNQRFPLFFKKIFKQT